MQRGLGGLVVKAEDSPAEAAEKLLAAIFATIINLFSFAIYDRWDFVVDIPVRFLTPFIFILSLDFSTVEFL